MGDGDIHSTAIPGTPAGFRMRTNSRVRKATPPQPAKTQRIVTDADGARSATIQPTRMFSRLLLLLLAPHVGAFTPTRIAACAHAQRPAVDSALLLGAVPARTQRRMPSPRLAEDGDKPVESAADDGYPGREVIRSIFAVIFEIQNVFFNVLGVLLACGLALNVCGLGYEFTPDGFVVKPLTEWREINADRRFARAADQWALFGTMPEPGTRLMPSSDEAARGRP